MSALYKGLRFPYGTGSMHDFEKSAQIEEMFPPCPYLYHSHDAQKNPMIYGAVRDYAARVSITNSEEQARIFSMKTANMNNPYWPFIWHFLVINNPSELDHALVTFKGQAFYSNFLGRHHPKKCINMFQVFYKFILTRKACMVVYLTKLPLEQMKIEFTTHRAARNRRVLRKMIKHEAYRRAYTKILITRLKLPLELINIIHEYECPPCIPSTGA